MPEIVKKIFSEPELIKKSKPSTIPPMSSTKGKQPSPKYLMDVDRLIGKELWMTVESPRALTLYLGSCHWRNLRMQRMKETEWVIPRWQVHIGRSSEIQTIIVSIVLLSDSSNLTSPTPPPELLHHPSSAYRIWNNGQILMLKVSKQQHRSPWYDRINCKWHHYLPFDQIWNLRSCDILLSL